MRLDNCPAADRRHGELELLVGKLEISPRSRTRGGVCLLRQLWWVRTTNEEPRSECDSLLGVFVQHNS